jgi:hypothetical protein
MAILDDMDRKLDELLSRMGEEINVHPDTLYPDAPMQVMHLTVTTNLSCPLLARFCVVDRDGGRYLRLDLRGPNYETVTVREWRAVYRDPLEPGHVVDRPGMDPRFRP